MPINNKSGTDLIGKYEYSYRAFECGGKEMSAIIRADSPMEAVSKIKAKDLFPTCVNAAASPVAPPAKIKDLEIIGEVKPALSAADKGGPIVGLTFYAVRNRNGQWFKAKGYGGYGKTWVNELTKARIYQRIGPARAMRTYFDKDNPQYGVPDIIELKVTEYNVLDESESVRKTAEKKAKAKLMKEQYLAKADLERAKREFNLAQQRLADAEAKARGKV